MTKLSENELKWPYLTQTWPETTFLTRKLYFSTKNTIFKYPAGKEWFFVVHESWFPCKTLPSSPSRQQQFLRNRAQQNPVSEKLRPLFSCHISSIQRLRNPISESVYVFQAHDDFCVCGVKKGARKLFEKVNNQDGKN